MCVHWLVTPSTNSKPWDFKSTSMWKFTAPLIVLFLTAIFLFLAATNIQGGWLYFVDALLWSVVLLGFLMPLFQSRRVQLERYTQGALLTGQPLTLFTQLKNLSRWPLSFMNLTEYRPQALRTLSPDTDHVLAQDFIDHLKPKSIHTLKSEYTPTQPGIHTLEKALTGSFGALGLLGVYRKQPHRFAFVVKPTPPEIGLKVNSPELQQALKSAHQPQQNPEDISHFRDYQPGDNRRAIHWRNSARQQSLVVGEARQDPLQRASLWVNVHAGQAREVATAVMTQAIAVAHLLHEQQLVLHCEAPPAQLEFWQDYGLLVPQRRMEEAKTWEELAQWLAHLEQDAPAALVFSPQSGALHVIVTDQIDPQWHEAVSIQNVPVLCFCMQAPSHALPPGWSIQRF